MTTKELIRQTCQQKLFILMMLYPDNPETALYRASRASNSLAELLRRKDFAPAFLQAYSSFDVNPKTNPHFEEESGYFATNWMLSLLNFPALRNQLNGHEKEVLSAVCRKYREIQKVNDSYPRGKAPYSEGSFPLDPAKEFAKKVFPKARIQSWRPTSGKDLNKQMEPAIQELEELSRK